MKKNVIILSDPVADMLTRIRNAIAVNKSVVELPHSNLKEKVAKILVDYGFLADLKASKDGERKVLQITINDEDQPAKITHIARVSRPGRRVYVKASDIPTIKRGRGIVILSTSKGVMASADARTKKLGGELICEVY